MGLADQATLRYVRLIRHGKSAAGPDDHQRPLNERGKRDGGNMQQWLAKQPHPAQWVLSSDALRAQTTAEFVAAGFGAELIPIHELYMADPVSILECVRSLPAEVSSIAVVGHNPAMTYCTNLLCGQPVTDNLVTFATVLLQFSCAWQDVAFGDATLLSVDMPRTLPQTEP